MNPSRSKQPSIDDLTSRFSDLHKLKIETEANLRNAREQLEEVQREARDQFGTDDLGQLREMLKALEAENEQKRADYQATLATIDQKLKEVDAEFAQADPGDDLP